MRKWQFTVTVVARGDTMDDARQLAVDRLGDVFETDDVVIGPVGVDLGEEADDDAGAGPDAEREPSGPGT